MALYICCFQAEDGIRATSVTGVQTCALPICRGGRPRQSRKGDVIEALPAAEPAAALEFRAEGHATVGRSPRWQIGRASCRERGSAERDARRPTSNTQGNYGDRE